MRRGWLLAALLAGCGFLEVKSKEHRVQTQDEAGSVHVAVVSVARWDKYKQHLQPVFSLTPEQALQRVLSISGTASSTQSEKTEVNLDATAGTRGTSGSSGGTSKGSSGGNHPTKIVSPRSDPMTQYWAATALYQEVQLLNRYVEDANLRKGYSAYVLRLQITLLPRARFEPYDAYTNVSFFVTEQDEGTSSRGLVDEGARAPGKAEVLPLLVTDNLEATLASSSRENLRALAASLSGGTTGASGSLGASKSAGEIDTSSGLDLNSLLTVARVSGNTLRIRLGAMRQGSAGYAMIPRSHAVTVLVMVKEEQQHIALVSRTTMVDVKDGKELRARTPEEVDQALLAAGAPYGIADLGTLRDLLRTAQANNVAEFYRTVQEWEGANDIAVAYKRSLWLDLVTVRAGSQYNSLVVDLKTASAGDGGGEGEVKMPPADTPVAVVDDGETCKFTLPTAPGLEQGKLHAALIIDGDSKPCRVVIADGTIVVTFKGSLKSRSAGGWHLELTQGEAFSTYRTFQSK